LRSGEFTAVGYRSLSDDREHVAFVYGNLGNGSDVLSRVHSECSLETASARCGAIVGPSLPLLLML
jgi:3,4-dihydroxy 2-butanone 4-phosphate synthase / GTP cyclohydrolase II